MKIIKRVLLMIVLLLFILIVGIILFEVFGMCVNHIATSRQTRKLQSNLENEIKNIKFIEVYSETGNTSGTGNHVDCLSSIKFSTQMQLDEIKNAMAEYYELTEWGCSISETDDGYFLFYLNTSAPFKDNIEGH